MSRNSELLIYVAHVVFWMAFGITRLVLSWIYRGGAVPTDQPSAKEERTAPYSRALLLLHMLAFGVMYFGIGLAVLPGPGHVPSLFAGQRAVGGLVIAIGALLACSALAYFRSWRFRAKLEKGHQLATGGPFRLMRHPIYTGLNLLAFGTALFIPTPIVWIAALLMIMGSDLRARTEEPLLVEAFGDSYRNYQARTRRFLPGIY